MQCVAMCQCCIGYVVLVLPSVAASAQECLPKSMGLGRELLRGRRTTCSVPVDFLELPPNHRIIPVWIVHDDVSSDTLSRNASAHKAGA